MWFERSLAPHFARLLEKRPAVLLTGARQTGKTSLARHQCPDYRYVTLDVPAHADAADNQGSEFLKRFPPPCVIDEVQYAPALFRHLKIAIDESRSTFGRFVLTGSQKFQLMEKAAESLAGRVAILETHPLSLDELERGLSLSAEGDVLDELILRGGFPEIHSEGLEADQFFADYVATYLERDVRQLVEVRNLRDFDRFLRLAATRTGQQVVISSFAGDLGISPNTVKTWFSVLEASNVACFVEPFSQNLGKRIVKSPKFYFLDTGLAAYLLGLRTIDELRRTPLRGALFETHVLTQMVRWTSARGQRDPIYFYRDHSGLEVDFVLPRGGQLTLIEVKLADNPLDSDLPFRAFENSTRRARIEKQAVITPHRGLRTRTSGTIVSDSVDWSWLPGSD